jgi:hypothetical protein
MFALLLPSAALGAVALPPVRIPPSRVTSKKHNITIPYSFRGINKLAAIGEKYFPVVALRKSWSSVLFNQESSGEESELSHLGGRVRVQQIVS